MWFPEVLCVRDSGAEIGQVILNLVKNAAESIGEEAGHVAITAEVDGDFVRVRVEDDGPGIPDDVLDRIFEPFFTTKAAGEGTGLGLAVCRKIVDAHGGSLEAESMPGGGAAFTMALRIAGANDGSEEEPEEDAAVENEPTPAPPVAQPSWRESADWAPPDDASDEA